MMQRRRLVLSTLALGAFASTGYGAEDRPIRLGVLTDLTGGLSAVNGRGSVTAVQLAVEDAGSQAAGHKVEILVGDHQNKPDIGLEVARRWFDTDGVDAILDVGNSAVALAVADLAREKNRLFLASAPATSALTDAHCSSNTVQWCDNYMLASALTRALVSQGGREWFFITADYAFGHDLQRLATDLIAKEGGKVVGSALHPPGIADFSSLLLQAQASGASVVALANAGNDTVNTIKQAAEFGLTTSGAKLAAFLAPINSIHALGLAQAGGLFVTEPFYWDLNDQTRSFSKAYFARMQSEANYAQAGGYSAAALFLATVDRVPSALGNGRQIIAAMKEKAFDDRLFGPSNVRADGRLIHRTYLFRVKTPAQSEGAWDCYLLMQQIPGDQAALPPGQSSCPLLKS